MVTRHPIPRSWILSADIGGGGGGGGKHRYENGNTPIQSFKTVQINVQVLLENEAFKGHLF